MDQALLRKIATAQATAGGNRIKDGKYTFEIVRVLCESKFKGQTFIVELLVREAAACEPKVDPNPVGSTCSWVLNLDKNVSAPGNVKGFILALYGVKEESTSSDDIAKTLAALVEPTQPAKGMLIKDETYCKPIQSGPNAGKPFTGHNWVNVPQGPSDVAARRTAQEASAAQAK